MFGLFFTMRKMPVPNIPYRIFVALVISAVKLPEPVPRYMALLASKRGLFPKTATWTKRVANHRMASSMSPDLAFPDLCSELMPFAGKFGFARILSQEEWDQEVRLTAHRCLQIYDPALGSFLGLFLATWKNHVFSLARIHRRNQRFIPVTNTAIDRLSLSKPVQVIGHQKLVPVATRSFTKALRIH
jgi:hypothetical protein